MAWRSICAGGFRRRVARIPWRRSRDWSRNCVVLPAVTWAITMLLQPRPSIALGMMVVAACPGGNISNLITHMARGNTALSVSMTGISSLLAVVTTPLNILFWAGLNPQTATLLRQVSVEPASFLGSTVLLLGVPMVLGLLTVRFLPLLADAAAATAADHVVRLPDRLHRRRDGDQLALHHVFAQSVLPFVVMHNAVAIALGLASRRCCG